MGISETLPQPVDDSCEPNYSYSCPPCETSCEPPEKSCSPTYELLKRPPKCPDSYSAPNCCSLPPRVKNFRPKKHCKQFYPDCYETVYMKAFKSHSRCCAPPSCMTGIPSLCGGCITPLNCVSCCVPPNCGSCCTTTLNCGT
ncbi:CLUMA_CG010642, isoform A [Clunio marinus]|uniref:CLUMA_CG010642, isoform A n=1 Tax=Clunio marinus TaxID=568069 RepID=A0A1J1IE16_9DIPT|nr:CLUMA_CG010642, isoform A [Clunio marinus]